MEETNVGIQGELSDERLEVNLLLESPIQRFHGKRSIIPVSARSNRQPSQHTGDQVLVALQAYSARQCRNEYGVLTLNYPGLTLLHRCVDGKNLWWLLRKASANRDQKDVNQSLPPESEALKVLNQNDLRRNQK